MVNGKPTQAQIDAAVAKYKKYKLSPRAALVADFIERYCTLSKGKGDKVGTPFRLLKWQFKCLKGMYPGKWGAKRVITRVLVSIARKNGKTEFASALVLVHLCGPEAGFGEQIICAAASSEKQASLVWDGARIMALAHPVFKARLATYGGARGHDGMTIMADSLVWESRKNTAITIGTKASSAQGLLPSFWTFDEIAETTDRKLYEALNLADDVSDGLGFIITTRSTKVDSMFSVLYDEAIIGQQMGINKHWYVQVHSADPEAKNPFTMAQVRKANPAIGEMIDPEKLKQKLENAKANPSARPEFRARVLNIDSGSQESLVDPTIWANAGIPWVPEEQLYEQMRGKEAILAIDLGSTTSLTALAVYWPGSRLVSVKNWMAKSQVDRAEALHKAPYKEWAEEGYLDLIASNHRGGMTYEPIAEHINKCLEMFNVKSFRYDGWNINRLFDALEKFDLYEDKNPIAQIKDPFIQGMKSYGEAITEFEDAMLNDLLHHDSNPMTTLSMNVCQTESRNRATEDLKIPVKNKQKLPNDAAVAILMAYSNRGVQLDGDEPVESFSELWDNANTENNSFSRLWD